MEERDVVIVGAGAAGLSAARELRRAGREVLVLERLERVGGRIYTVHPAGGDLPIELGAEFSHGPAPVTRALLDELGLRYVADGGGTRVLEAGRVRRAPGYLEQIGAVLARIDTSAPDRPFAEFLESVPAPRAARDATRRFVEGFHAAEAERISTHALASQAGEVAQVQESARVLGGQRALVQGLAALAQAEIRLRTSVTDVAWSRGRCELRGRDAAGEPFAVRARAVVITVSIGVLQRRELRLEPEPPGFARALGLLAMGDVVRIPFVFDARFWEDPGCAGGALREAGFIHVPGAQCHVWWTQYPVLAPLLVAWSGGGGARELLRLGPEARAAWALQELAGALGVPARVLERRLVLWQAHDWSTEPATRGAYSYALVGGAGAARALARLHQGTLVLAGEALAAETGTVEGALASGRSAARRLLRAR